MAFWGLSYSPNQTPSNTTTTIANVDNKQDNPHLGDYGGIGVIMYRGRQLYCITFDRAYAGDRVCDFNRFYNENPDLVNTK
jgi:hypothetical protein